MTDRVRILKTVPFLGFRLALDPEMPPDRVDFVQDGKVVGRIVNLGARVTPNKGDSAE